MQDPYTAYDRMRALGSLVYWQDYDLTCTTSYAATNAVLRDRRFGRVPLNAPQIAPHLAPFYAVEAHSMLELEPPRHTRLRALVLRAFTSRRIAALGPQIDALVEECLRFDPALHLFTRWAYDDIDVMGVTIPRGAQIACLLGAANRCPRHWEDAHLFIPTRHAKPHTGFGAGLHFCLGAPLARLEMRHALTALCARLPRLALVEPPRMANIYHFHGLERLMVTVD